MSYEDLVAEILSYIPAWQNAAADLPGAEGRELRKTLRRFDEDIREPIL